MSVYFLSFIICLILVILFTELFRTRGYEIKNEKIIIKRFIKKYYYIKGIY